MLRSSIRPAAATIERSTQPSHHVIAHEQEFGARGQAKPELVGGCGPGVATASAAQPEPSMVSPSRHARYRAWKSPVGAGFRGFLLSLVARPRARDADPRIYGAPGGGLDARGVRRVVAWVWVRGCASRSHCARRPAAPPHELRRRPGSMIADVALTDDITTVP